MDAINSIYIYALSCFLIGGTVLFISQLNKIISAPPTIALLTVKPNTRGI